MITAEKRNEILEKYLTPYEVISTKLQGLDVANRQVAILLIEHDTKGGMSNDEYNKFIAPYLNELCETVDELTEEQLQSVKNQLYDACKDEDKETRKYFHTNYQCIVNTQKALKRQLAIRKRRLDLAYMD